MHAAILALDLFVFGLEIFLIVDNIIILGLAVLNYRPKKKLMFGYLGLVAVTPIIALSHI